MNSIVILVLAAAFGIGLGIGYNILVIKKHPEYKRKSSYVLTVFVFLVVTLALYGIMRLNVTAKSAADEYSHKLVQYLNVNHPSNDFVKNGYDLAGINKDISGIDNIIKDIKDILPSHTELGINEIIYDLILSFAEKKVMEISRNTNKAVKIVNSFSDENNYLTVASVTEGLRNKTNRLVNNVTIVCISIVAFLFLFYVIYSLVTAMNEKKKNVATPYHE